MESCCSVVIPKTPSKLNRAPPRNCLPWENCNTRCLFHTRIRVAPVGRCYAGELDKIRSQDYSLGLYPCLKRSSASTSKKFISTITRCSGDDKDETSNSKKTPFGYTRKDVILIGVGVTAAGVGLKSGLEYAGVDPLQAGNVVQLVLVLGLTVGWISTYIFRVGNKEMTYAQQLRDYEVKVMEKRLESLTEAEIQVLLEQVEEEKQRLTGGEQVK